MSTTIDSRVVEMRFDNKQFESGVATTISTLEKFKQKLKLDGATKGMEQLDAAAKKIDFSSLEYAATRAGFQVQDVWLKVASVLEYQIARRIINAGKQITSALVIDPIKTGLQEYETQINAVQTILANTESKGTTLDQVNGALDTLNTYADKTIYNFTEMTRNIGTFTAAGVDLDTSVNAIQGIANLAAVSGSNSQQASTAMYQLSQALASGTVKLMDWNSVVNAGMGGQVFQDALKETARVHGIAIDDMIEKNGSFRETLQEGWLTADILTETLSHFTMAAEEGSAEWEKYKKSLKDSGYSEEQANAILKLSNTATDAATKVKTATQLWDTLKETAQSGWTQTWEIIIGDFEEAKSLWSGIYETLSPMLEATSEARNKLLEGAMTSNWSKMIAKINEAGIETTRFEDKLRSTVEAHGIDVDKLIEDHGSLEKAFRSGAVSTDILKEAVASLEGNLLDLQSIERDLAKGNTGEDVKKVQEALSNLGYDLGKWGTDGILGGATEKAIKAFQEAQGLKVTGIVDESTIKALEEASGKAEGLSDSVGGLISGIDKLGGRELLIESLKNVFEGVMSVVKPIGEAFREIFPPTTVEQLYSLIEGIHTFSKKLILGETASDNLKRTFKGLFAVLDIVKQAFGAVFKALSPLFGKVDDLGGGILGMTAKLGDWLVSLNESIKTSNIFETAIDKVRTAFDKVKNFLQPVVEGIKTFADEVSKNLNIVSENAKERLGPLTVLGNFIKAIFVGLGNAIKSVFPFITAAAKGIGGVLSDLMGRITDSIQNANYDAMFDLASGGIMTAIGVFVAKFFKSGSDMLDGASGFMENLSQIPENINNILSGVSDALGAFTDSLKADTLKKIATAIAILAVSLLVLSLIPSEKLADSLIVITTLFGELMGSMNIMSKIGDVKGIGKMAAALVSLSTALLVMSIALKIMSTMSWSEMGVGLISMTVGLGELVGAVYLLSMIPEKDLKSSTNAIKSLASSLLVLSIALKIMGSMSWEQMGVALISMTVGLGALIGAIWLLPKDTAIRVAGLVGLATAMVILGAALKIMATMSWGELAVSLVALAGSLAIIAGAMYLMTGAIPGALAMLIVAPALVVLAGAMKLLGGLSWEEIGRGLVALGGSLAILAIGLTLMIAAMPGAAALLVAAAALAVLTPVLMALGSMSLAEIGKGLLAIAGVFVVLGLAALILQPLVPTIFALAASIALLGVACLAAGAGILMIGVGITAIATALAASGGAITVFIASLISLIPFLIEQIGLGIIKLCEVIAGSASAICEAVAVIIIAVVDALVAAVPSLVDGLLVLIISLLDSLINYLPSIVSKLVTLVVGLLSLLTGYVPVLMDSIFSLLVAIIDSLSANINRIVTPLVNLVVTIFQGLADAIAPIINEIIIPILNTFKDIIIEVADAVGGVLEDLGGVFDTVFDGISEVVDSVGSSIKKVLDGIAGIIDSIGEAALNAGTGFENMAKGVKIITDLNLADMAASLAAVATGIGKIAKHADEMDDIGNGMKNLGKALITNMVEGIDSQLVKLTKAAKDAIEKFADGIKAKQDTANKACKKLVTHCADVISDESSSFKSAGKDLGAGLVKGINAKKQAVYDAAYALGQKAVQGEKDGQKSKSPSKLTIQAGKWLGEGLVIGMEQMGRSVYSAGYALGENATKTISATISRMSDVLSTDIDAQPTIRPVIDLSDVKSGASAISGMLNMDSSVGVRANIGAISSMMSSRGQNGSNTDVVSAINKLSKELGKTHGDTYHINGVTYDDGSNITDAVATLVRAARIERRV